MKKGRTGWNCLNGYRRLMPDFTLIIPIHNEEAILRENAVKLHEYLKSLPYLDSFEIILALNGCTDGSERISAELAVSNPRIRHITIAGRGLGTAIKEAALAASYDMMMFYAIDLPFGLQVIGSSVETALKKGDSVVIGSKGHPDSDVQRTLARSLFSFTIATLNNVFFGLGVKDTQGSILFHKEPLRRFADLMDSPGAFFQTQILIYSKVCGADLIEIPVALKEVRRTRFKLIGDGLKYLSSILKEKKKLASHGIR